MKINFGVLFLSSTNEGFICPLVGVLSKKHMASEFFKNSKTVWYNIDDLNPWCDHRYCETKKVIIKDPMIEFTSLILNFSGFASKI